MQQTVVNLKLTSHIQLWATPGCVRRCNCEIQYLLPIIHRSTKHAKRYHSTFTNPSQDLSLRLPPRVSVRTSELVREYKRKRVGSLDCADGCRGRGTTEGNSEHVADYLENYEKSICPAHYPWLPQTFPALSTQTASTLLPSTSSTNAA